MKLTIPKLKNKLDRIFSRYIRLRDCIATTGTLDNGRCITCGKIITFKSSHAGHFQSRRYGSTRYHEKNVKLQCSYCNCFQAGEQYAFSKEIDRIYGKGTAEELEQLAHREYHFKRYELEELIKYYTAKVKEME